MLSPAGVQIGDIVLDRWRIEAVLGQGGAASVFAARDGRGVPVALKVLDPIWSGCPEVVSRFLREERIYKRLRHPALVPVLATFVADDGSPGLVMELLRGADLDRHVHQHRLELGSAFAIVDRVLDVLCHAHRAGIVHRDLKPENVFVEQAGSIRVLDFGVAHFPSPGESPLTRVGCLLGTPQYMSPEQARAEPEIDERSDLWSLGALFAFLLTGEPVRAETDDINELGSAASVPVPSLAALAPGADRRLVAFVDRALAFDPAARFATAERMRAALHELFWALFGLPIPSRITIDRRRERRLASSFAVGLHARRGARVGVCRSYSASGLLVATPSQFSPGEPVAVELPASATGSGPLIARGAVRRVSAASDGGLFSKLCAIELSRPIPSHAHRAIAERVAG